MEALGKLLKLKTYICFLLISAVDAAISDDCRTIQFQPEIKNKVLKNYMIRSMKVQRKSMCESQCFLEPSCVSYNYGPTSSDTPSCHLNNRTHLQTSVDDFVREDLYSYRSILNPCQSSPCKSGSTCHVGFTAKGYRCICPNGFDGNQCESVASPSPVQSPALSPTSSSSSSSSSFSTVPPSQSPWIAGPSGVSYHLLDDPQTWFNAQSGCRNLGAQLVKIESATVNDFIKTKFLDTSGNYDEAWIGLYDQVNPGTWVWSDGSPSTGYQNWGGMLNNQHCTAIRYDGHWNDKACDEDLKFICMK